MAKNKNSNGLDGFEKGVIFLSVGSYVVITVGVLLQSLLALSVKPPLAAFTPLIYWLVIGVVFVIGWIMMESVRYLIAMLPVVLLILGLWSGLGQLGRDIEASAPPDNYYVYPTAILPTPTLIDQSLTGNQQNDMQTQQQLTQEQQKWIGEKYTFDPAGEAGIVLSTAYMTAVAAYLLNILTRNRYRLQIIFLVLWLLAFSLGLVVPGKIGFYFGFSIVNSFPDPATAAAAKALWQWGAMQSLFWMGFKQLLSWTMLAMSKGAYKAGRLATIFYSALSWAFTSLVLKIINPDIYTFYLATNSVHQTALSLNMAMALVWSGQFTFIALDGAYMTIKNIIIKLLTPPQKKKEDEQKKKEGEAANV